MRSMVVEKLKNCQLVFKRGMTWNFLTQIQRLILWVRVGLRRFSQD